MNRESELLKGTLKNVSRSFYKTLRILPSPIRPQIGTAYLLARTSDTIADTTLVDPEQRLSALRLFGERVAGASNAPLTFADLASRQGVLAERRLLEEVEDVLRLLKELSSGDLDLVRDVLSTIISGQELDLQRFALASAQNIVSLQTDAELDDYTYRVAGCVGKFWTLMCRQHLFPAAVMDVPSLVEQGIRFGKGLQLVNILRDVPADLRHGRCYMPFELLRRTGLAPVDLLKADTEPAFRPLYNELLDRAQAHLLVGWTYTNSLPRGQIRVRLACAWPILIGLATLRLLRTNPILSTSKPIKIRRSEVRAILCRSVLLYPFPGAWRALDRSFVVP